MRLLFACLVVVACCAATSTAAASAGKKKNKLGVKKLGDAQATDTAHIPSDTAVELHHSLHRPLDQSQVYWNFGGSTVLTKKHIRLTPSAQNRKGWVWNDYPLEAENWQVEFEVDIYSKPHFGGDGFAFWLLDGSQDPTFHSDPTYLNGDVFGIKPDFAGLGICFDVYDNDGKRDNPSIFVLYNPDGKMTNYNHDNDYEDDMYKRVSPGTNAAYQCVANIRNTEAPTKVMVKFLHKILHVYVDTHDGLGYKFCLAVEFDAPFKEHHIAFTAVTGQVADAHDVVEVSTRYLDSSLQDPDDTARLYSNDLGSCSTMRWIYWALVTIAGVGALSLGVTEFNKYKQLSAAGINLVDLCTKMNETADTHLAVFFSIVVLLLVDMQWVPLLLFAPLIAVRGMAIYKKNYKLTPEALGGEKGHGGASSSMTMRLGAPIGVYVFANMYFLYAWFYC